MDYAKINEAAMGYKDDKTGTDGKMKEEVSCQR